MQNRQGGVALILVAILGVGLMVLSVLSVQTTMARSVAERVQRDAFMAGQIADSASAHAMVRIKEGGFLTPASGSGASPQWVTFSGGQYYYYTTFDATTNTSTIRAWGRVPVNPNPSTSTDSPDSILWDGTGWLVRGVEITIKSFRFIPRYPLFFGNGGIEEPLGGFFNTSGVDPADPSTWVTVTGSPDSHQASSVPFVSSALDHPVNYLYADTDGVDSDGDGLDADDESPAPATANPHPYKIWASQNIVGQFNIEAWFANSAGAGNDPTVVLTPPPTSAYYDTSDPTSPDYPYPVDPNIPDVQDFTWQLWNRYKDDMDVTRLGGGSHSGTYGDLSNPGITFVTGALTVAAGTTFRGAGILVIRDDYDPNVDTNNTPGTASDLYVNGKFEWTGLVMIAGWAPAISVSSGGDATVVGALFGEDSVQSGGELSLDSATIIMSIQDSFRVLFSNSLFQPGGLIHNMLPLVKKEVIGIRAI